MSARHAGLILAVAYLGAGVVGYLLAGPFPEGSSLPVLWAAIAIAVITARVWSRPNPLPSTVSPWVCPAVVGPIALYSIFGPVTFNCADHLGDQKFIFNIGGNNFRLAAIR